MREKLREMTLEALSAVLPITLIVFAFTVLVSPAPIGIMMLFLVGAALLIIGMGLLTTGVDMSLMPLGNDIGVSMTKPRKIALICAVSFVMGMTISFAEPDLQVLSRLVPGIERMTLLITVSIGVGCSLLLAVLRIILSIALSKIIIVCYSIMIVLAIIAPHNFVPVAFDAGGVVTGPVAVPFILAMGLGIASIRSDRVSTEDSFGLVALCVIGPVMSVMLLGLIFNPEGASYVPPVIPAVETTRDVMLQFAQALPRQFIAKAQSTWPIVAVFLLFQLLTRHYHKRHFIRLAIGFGYTYIGLVLFMTGVDVGFIPVGAFLGADLAGSGMKWVLIPFGGLLGYFVVAAEPAVHVLRKQVEAVSLGVIPGAAVQRYLSGGVAVSLSLTMLRILVGIPIYWLLFPCYVLAIALMFFVPKIYTGIAFDTAGVVTGPMTSTFILPFAIGACINPERIMLDGFGTVALIAMTPPVSLQLMGVLYARKEKLAVPARRSDTEDDEIIVFSEDEGEDEHEQR